LPEGLCEKLDHKQQRFRAIAVPLREVHPLSQLLGVVMLESQAKATIQGCAETMNE